MLSFTAVIIAASLKVDALRGCDYGAGTSGFEDVCAEEGAAEKGLVGKMWIPCAIGAIASLIILICVPIGAENNDDGDVVSIG